MLLTRVAKSDGGLALTRAVTLDDAKAHLNVYHDTDDALIESYCDVAQAHLEGHDGLGGILGVAITRHMLDLSLEHVSGDRIALPQPPLVSVTWVKYLDVDGIERTFASSSYNVVTDRGGGYIRLKPTASWPAVQPLTDDAIRIRYTAGHANVPAALRHAILLHVGHLYANRGDGGSDVANLPPAYKALTDPFRTHGWI